MILGPNTTVEEILNQFQQELGELPMRMMPTFFREPCPICNQDDDFPIVIIGPKMCERCHIDALAWAAKQAFKEKSNQEGNPFYQGKVRS